MIRYLFIFSYGLSLGYILANGMSPTWWAYVLTGLMAVSAARLLADEVGL